ncbi:hypothetical protein D3C71_998370 [compost metagenome]
MIPDELANVSVLADLQILLIAADKALDPGFEAHALVGKFNQTTQAVKTTAGAVDEVTKARDASNVQGNNTAISALDAWLFEARSRGLNFAVHWAL